MGQSTLQYLEKRYLELEQEIANQSLHDHYIADLKHRRLVVADEIKRHRQLIELMSERVPAGPRRAGFFHF